MTELGGDSDQDLFIYHRLRDEQLESFRDPGYSNYGHILTHRGRALMREQGMATWHEDRREFN